MRSTIIRSVPAAMDVLEAAHSDGGDLAAWAARTADAGQTLFDLPAMTLSVVERGSQCYRELAREGSGLAAYDRVEEVPLPVMDCLFRLAQVARPTDLVQHMPEPFQVHWRAFTEKIGMYGGGGVMGYVGRVCFALFGFAEDPTAPISGRDRVLLRQVAAHIEVGLALRLGETKPVAILRPDGRIVHAEHELCDASTLEHVSQHVQKVDSLRTRRQRRAPTALDTWTALVNGSWGLVERVDRDGRRFYLIVNNGPVASRIRALTDHEARVLELSARGASGKSVAYTLGISAAAVSQALAAAALKVGCKTRTELVYSASLLLGPNRDSSIEAGLTHAERDVLDQVRAGFSNAEIAAQRQTSQRTVSNQVARLLKKAKAPSRRALAAWAKAC